MRVAAASVAVASSLGFVACAVQPPEVSADDYPAYGYSPPAIGYVYPPPYLLLLWPADILRRPLGLGLASLAPLMADPSENYP